MAHWLCGDVARAARPEIDPRGELTFERDIRPILKTHCFHCHGEGQEQRGGLDLRLRRFMVEGGDSGAAITPGSIDDSLLLARVESGEMPPGDETHLSSEDLQRLRDWVAGGAPTARPEPEQLGPDDIYITQEERNHWSFQPIRRPPLPAVQQASQVRTPIDAFVLARLQDHDLGLAPAADRATLLRRVYLDLVGLPPTPEQTERFLNDSAPDAYERVVERLLDSPRFGERWARHWLDVAGYADSEGFTLDDPERPDAYKYRDYVIRSFNADKPIDQFIIEQLAGDELVTPPYEELTPDEIDKLVATGFLRMAPDGTADGSVEQGVARNQTIADSLDIVTSSLLGLTVACAQCHDHRYDPIPQRDYYQLRAVFEPAYDWHNWRVPRARRISLYTDADRQKAKEIEAEAAAVEAERAEKQEEFIQRTFEKELAKLDESLHEPIRKARETPEKERSEEQKQLLKKHPSVNVSAGSLYLYDRKAADRLKEYTEKAKQIRAKKPVEEFVRALTEVPGRVPESFLFFRGDHEQPKQQVKPAILTVLAPPEGLELPENDPDLPTSGRRLAYARWLTDPRHPLTSRVFVNRVWLQLFGRGLVDTPGDFGLLGSAPTHPQLLDWLASEFQTSGWSLKQLVRLIVTSATYQQSAVRRPEHEAVDPENYLLARMNIRRLDAETLRDTVLAVTGKLNYRQFGSPVPVMADTVGQIVIGIENLNAGRPQAVIPMKGEDLRRSIYVQVRRSRPLSVLDTFDAPAMDPNCVARNASTVAPQALMFMNSPFVVEQSRAFADRLVQEAGEDPGEQIRQAFLWAFAQPASAAEVQQGLRFLEDQTEQLRAAAEADADDKKKDADARTPEQEALATFCQALISSNRFLYSE